MSSKFLVFQSKLLTSLSMVLIRQHKNHLGVLWGRSTEHDRLDMAQINQSSLMEKMEWSVPVLCQEMAVDLSKEWTLDIKQSNSAQTSWKSLTVLFFGFLHQQLTECLEFFWAEFPWLLSESLFHRKLSTGAPWLHVHSFLSGQSWPEMVSGSGKNFVRLIAGWGEDSFYQKIKESYIRRNVPFVPSLQDCLQYHFSNISVQADALKLITTLQRCTQTCGSSFKVLLLCAAWQKGKGLILTDGSWSAWVPKTPGILWVKFSSQPQWRVCSLLWRVLGN